MRGLRQRAVMAAQVDPCTGNWTEPSLAIAWRASRNGYHQAIECYEEITITSPPTEGRHDDRLGHQLPERECCARRGVCGGGAHGLLHLGAGDHRNMAMA